MEGPPMDNSMEGPPMDNSMVGLPLESITEKQVFAQTGNRTMDPAFEIQYAIR